MQQHRLAAIMFTDIVGYTALMQLDEAKAIEKVKRHQEIIEEAVIAFHGKVNQYYGDGSLSVFSSAIDAVNSAKQIQNKCKLVPVVPLRIGIDLGEISVEEDQVFGHGVNLSSRIQNQAPQGGIYISESVYNNVRNKAGIICEFVCEKELKNVDRPIKLYAVKLEEGSVSEPKTSIESPQQTKKKSIIVLPFINMSPDPDQEYFSDGLTEEIITDLSYIHDLLVISRNSAMTFKGSNMTTKEIADKVNVRYVLEGSVRKSGNKLRITAQLIDGKIEAHLWAEKYSGILDDVFDIQEKVSQAIVDALKIKLGPEEKQKIISRSITNFQAYDLLIKAQSAMLTLTEEGFNRAIKHINQGLDIIGENEILYAALGKVYLHFIEFGLKKEESTFKKVEESVDKVFSLNPNSEHGYYLRGHLNRWEGNILGSINDYSRALSINPNHFYSTFYLSWIYGFTGKVKLAEPIVQRLLKIDPLNFMSYMMIGAVKILGGQFNQAPEFFQKAYELEPLPFLGWWLLKAHAYNNNLGKALQLMDRIGSKAPATHWNQLILFFKYALQKEKSKALEVVTEEFKDIMKGDEFYPIWMAESYALIGHLDESMDWIEEGVNNFFYNYPFLTKYDPFLENIRQEPRFKELMKRVKYEWEHFEV